MKKIFLVLLADVMIFATAAGSKAEVTDEKGIISLDLAGDFKQSDDFKLPEVKLAPDSKSDYYTNSLRPTLLVGTINYSPGSKWRIAKSQLSAARRRRHHCCHKQRFHRHGCIKAKG